VARSARKPELSAILDSVADGVFTVDRDWRLTSFNKAAERITGVGRADAIGQPCCEVFRASICESACALRETTASGKPVVNRPIRILAADGRSVPISISTALLKDSRGRVIGGVETFRDLSLVEELRKELRAKYTFGDIVTKSAKMREILAVLPQVAESGSTCLIEGESGTGKELVARAIHAASSRAEGPFVAVNCGALPDTLLESELFGYVKGAFTDARRDKPGRFAQAGGGSLLLDEIGDVSPALQTRLLRVLQEREYEPLGSNTTVKADVRVIAATNRPLDELVKEGAFRQDLYYRVNVVRLVLPPLRERREDIPFLVEHFVDRLNRLRGRDVAGLSDEALALFVRYDWPGNVRELENALEHAFVLCRGGLIRPECLPDSLRPSTGTSLASTAGLTLEALEARAIRDALQRHGGKRVAAARELGISKTTLWRRIKRLNIAVPSDE